MPQAAGSGNASRCVSADRLASASTFAIAAWTQSRPAWQATLVTSPGSGIVGCSPRPWAGGAPLRQRTAGSRSASFYHVGHERPPSGARRSPPPRGEPGGRMRRRHGRAGAGGRIGPRARRDCEREIDCVAVAVAVPVAVTRPAVLATRGTGPAGQPGPAPDAGPARRARPGPQRGNDRPVGGGRVRPAGPGPARVLPARRL